MKRHIIKELNLSEISAVDFPAQEGARMIIMKRDFSQGERDKAAESGAAMPDGSFPIKNATDLKNAIHLAGHAKDSAAAKRHIISRAKAIGAESQLPSDWVSKAAVSGDNVSKENNMSDELKKVADLEKQVADLTKRATDAEAKVVAGVVAAEAKVAEVTKAKEAVEKDEVIKVGETEVKKSAVGDATFAVIKAQQLQIKDEVEKRELVELTKRAETELPTLPGESVAKAKVLRAINKMAEEDRKVLETMLKAGDAAMKSSFREIGQGGGSANDASSPAGQLEKMADDHAGKHNISKAAAMDAVLRTPDGRRLYNESHGNKKAA